MNWDGCCDLGLCGEWLWQLKWRWGKEEQRDEKGKITGKRKSWVSRLSDPNWSGLIPNKCANFSSIYTKIFNKTLQSFTSFLQTKHLIQRRQRNLVMDAPSGSNGRLLFCSVLLLFGRAEPLLLDGSSVPLQMKREKSTTTTTITTSSVNPRDFCAFEIYNAQIL